jgi:hypothetical protein
VVLDRPSGPDLLLKVSPTTPVSGNAGVGQQPTVDQLPTGTEVRVEYRVVADQPTAESVAVSR